MPLHLKQMLAALINTLGIHKTKWETVKYYLT